MPGWCYFASWWSSCQVSRAESINPNSLQKTSILKVVCVSSCGRMQWMQLGENSRVTIWAQRIWDAPTPPPRSVRVAQINQNEPAVKQTCEYITIVEFISLSVCVCVCVLGDGVCFIPVSMLLHRQSRLQKRKALIHGDMRGTVLSHSRYI